jgi:hypothetical protein
MRILLYKTSLLKVCLNRVLLDFTFQTEPRGKITPTSFLLLLLGNPHEFSRDFFMTSPRYYGATLLCSQSTSIIHRIHNMAAVTTKIIQFLRDELESF